ncbi:MAG: amino-acid N-acetyltransferase [Gammaproteobacteria bacterium]|nr:amino-acid N-acetyltransferase [Gammaproteobacteria bacterium]
MIDSPQEFVRWFREASPYIHAHRSRTFVIVFGGEALLDAAFEHLIHDLALLVSLGIRLVVVHGARPQVETRLRARGIELRYVDGLRVTDTAAMECVKDAVGTVRVEIEALLSMGLANSPMAGARIRVTTGNFITARPLGIRNGTDFRHTGVVRRVDTETINAQLDAGGLVLVPPLGYSPTGEIFNLNAEEVGTAVAAELHAAKLIFLLEGQRLLDTDGDLVREIIGTDLPGLLAALRAAGDPLAWVLQLADQACRNGVRRVHLLDRQSDGALIRELFTRDGAGTLVSASPFDDMRSATIDDAAGILEIIRPLEADGTLVWREREKLEMEIGQFTVVARDGVILGCAALFPYPGESVAELACLAVGTDYRRGGYGQALLDLLEGRARQLGVRRLFVLTTQAEHWFEERGFVEADIDALPVERKALYNYQRNSKVLIKAL